MGRRIIDLEDPAFGELFQSIERSWFRLETLQVYTVAYEADRVAAFLAGERVDLTPGPWQEMIRRHRAAGRQLARVHIVEEPLSDYIRYELAIYPRALAAGEDVRIIPTRRGAWPPGLPHKDFWILDDAVWRMDYDDDGRFTAMVLIDDPAVAARYHAWRDAAHAASVPYARYTAGHPLLRPTG